MLKRSIMSAVVGVLSLPAFEMLLMWCIFLQLSQQGSKLVLEQVLTTIATVADTAEARFVKYYDRFMPSLKYIFENAVSKEYRLLRGKCIECISLIGLAVGRDKVCFEFFSVVAANLLYISVIFS